MKEQEIKEEWRVLKLKGKLRPAYEISSMGRLRRAVADQGRTRVGRLLTPHHSSKRGRSYPQVVLSENGKHTTCRIHRAVAETFIGDPAANAEVNHIDGDKTNNAVTNLEYLTHQKNVAHAVATLLMDRKGEKHPMAKVTADQVREIRQLLATTETSMSRVARMYGISPSHVRSIRDRRSWEHLAD